MVIPVSQVQRSSKPPKSATELLKEIAALELEVLQLEKYLGTLYQKALDRRVASLLSPKDSKDITISEKRISSEGFQMPSGQAAINNIILLEENNRHEAKEQEELLGCSIHRTHSSLSHHSVYASRLSPSVGKVADAVNSYHSLPLSLLEPEASYNVAIYDSNEVKETANWLSEEMIRCISAIYCELATNSVISKDFSSPAISFPSSMSGSPRAEFNMWSPQSRMNSLQVLHPDVSCQAGGHYDYTGPYCQMVEVLQIRRDSTKLRDIEPMLQKFRSLVNKLEGVNPSKLNHQEKLAFWINVHNALVMHAFLEYGVPQNKLKRVSLLLKAAYSIGGHTISVSMIQDYIIRSPLPHPGQWFHRLLHLKKKIFRSGDRRRFFAIDHSEPLSYFALCCGNYSDPPVHVYTSQELFHDLIAARNQYILSNYRFHKEQNKILLPKILENYAKDSGLHPPDFMKILEQILPADIKRNRSSSFNFRHKKGWKGIDWTTHDFSFRYQFPKELLQ